MHIVPRDFYQRASAEVAPDLLGKHLDLDGVGGRIVEVEAYGGSGDPASHAYRGRTPRNGAMFGPPGRVYVYLIYGMHWCANLVCLEEGTASAVLIRALCPTQGLEDMRRRRLKARRDRDLCSGPGRLCQALGIDGEYNDCDAVTGDRGLRVYDDGSPPPPNPGQGTRIGISVGIETPWRWTITGDPNLSKPGASPS